MYICYDIGLVIGLSFRYDVDDVPVLVRAHVKKR